MKTSYLVFILNFFILFSCTKEKADLPKKPEPAPTYCDSMLTAAKVSYRCYVDSVIETRCISCHKPGGTGTGDFTSYQGVKTYANSIADRIQPTPPSGGQRMPQGGPYLSPEVIDKITVWVNDGAMEN